MSYQDAVLACEAGCEGIVLSNHGGMLCLSSGTIEANAIDEAVN
jgi:isopentenyl diphosphate isomerase/L-lactate dehydrogenase-like FMN-dependent dehydrogenase